MFLLYSFTSSLVCTEVSVGACLTWWAAADNYLLKNAITLSSTVATQTYQSVSHLYKDFFFFFPLSCRTGRCFNSCSLLLILTGGIVPHLRDGFSARVAQFSPWEMWSAGTKGILFSQARQHCLRAEGGEGWRGQRKGKEEKSSSRFVML